MKFLILALAVFAVPFKLALADQITPIPAPVCQTSATCVKAATSCSFRQWTTVDEGNDHVYHTLSLARLTYIDTVTCVAYNGVESTHAVTRTDSVQGSDDSYLGYNQNNGCPLDDQCIKDCQQAVADEWTLYGKCQ